MINTRITTVINTIIRTICITMINAQIQLAPKVAQLTQLREAMLRDNKEAQDSWAPWLDYESQRAAPDKA